MEEGSRPKFAMLHDGAALTPPSPTAGTSSLSAPSPILVASTTLEGAGASSVSSPTATGESTLPAATLSSGSLVGALATATASTANLHASVLTIPPAADLSVKRLAGRAPLSPPSPITLDPDDPPDPIPLGDRWPSTAGSRAASGAPLAGRSAKAVPKAVPKAAGRAGVGRDMIGWDEIGRDAIGHAADGYARPMFDKLGRDMISSNGSAHKPSRSLANGAAKPATNADPGSAAQYALREQQRAVHRQRVSPA